MWMIVRSISLGLEYQGEKRKNLYVMRSSLENQMITQWVKAINLTISYNQNLISES